MSEHPYDPEVLEHVARLLYEAMPAMYRVPDQADARDKDGNPIPDRGQLLRTVRVLAAPHGALRQSILETHADQFIDTAADGIIPLLAEMVGTKLVFPDAASNRRDVRGTVAWRRRKGTPPALEEMGTELTAQPVVLQEGWKRVQMTQDLNLLRLDRVVPDLRPAVVAEQGAGPLDALFGAVDVRPISAAGGLRHPRRVAHWLHTTVTFPLRGATAFERPPQVGADVRFAFDPLGGRHALRAAREPGDDRPFVDRVPERHFAADPGRWFGREGGFTIDICGVAAGVAGGVTADRVAETAPASAAIARGTTRLSLLEQPSRGWRGPVKVELGLAGTTAAGDGRQPDLASFTPRATIELDASGVVSSSSAPGDGPTGDLVALLRLTPVGATGRFFPGTTLEAAGGMPGARAASSRSQLAREGFFEGVLHLAVPPLTLLGSRHLLVAADGSLYDTHDGADLRTIPVRDGALVLDRDALSGTGPGAAWPPLPIEAEPRMLSRVPGAPGHGPAVLHGARPLLRTGTGLEEVAATDRCALTFAVAVANPGVVDYRPFERLTWEGGDPLSATWEVLDPDSLGIAKDREADPDDVALAVRFECSAAGATLCPGEVAWTADDGQTVLIHLPQLNAEPPPTGTRWPLVAPMTVASEPVRVAEDGSTWAAASTENRRMSLGAVAPIAGVAGIRRRRVRGRLLCAWDAEDWTASPPEIVPLTEPGRLDVDVEHGLFAFAAQEPPQAWPAGVLATIPPSVTTDFREGATMHVGARPDVREPVVDRRLPRPTRLVTRSGALRPDAPADWHLIPRYATLTDALKDVSTRWKNLTPADLPGVLDPKDRVPVAEVIEFQDSATYPGEAPAWPLAPTDADVKARAALSLTIQAAERERPVVVLDDWDLPAGAAALARLAFLGVAFGGEPAGTLSLPRAREVDLELCTLLDAANELRFADAPEETAVRVNLCETAGLFLQGAGTLRVRDSIVDARTRAIRARTADVELDRASVRGTVLARTLEASEVIFDGRVEVEDRFRGCVRFSRVTGDSTLPRVHRVAVDAPLRLVSRARRDAGWWRLREDCDPRIARGAENGSEMGAFARTLLAERIRSFGRRLEEYTPAGLVTGIIRID